MICLIQIRQKFMICLHHTDFSCCSDRSVTNHENFMYRSVMICLHQTEDFILFTLFMILHQTEVLCQTEVFMICLHCSDRSVMICLHQTEVIHDLFTLFRQKCYDLFTPDRSVMICLQTEVFMICLHQTEVFMICLHQTEVL